MLVQLFRYTACLFLTGILGCANPQAKWLVNQDCSPLGVNSTVRYTVKLATQDAGKQLFVLINQWDNGVLNSVAVNPMGVKLFSASWDSTIFILEVNPLYKKIDFSLALQGVIFSEWLTASRPDTSVDALTSCLSNSELVFLNSAPLGKVLRQGKGFMDIVHKGSKGVSLDFHQKGYLLEYHILNE